MPDGQEPIEVACKVIWTNRYGKETKDLRRGMGVKFLQLQPEAQNRIEEHMKSHKNENLLLKN
jgi:Tfp pilus assembly protein PilZ